MEIRPVAPAEHAAAGRVVLDAYRAVPGGHVSQGYAAQLADVAGRAADALVLVAAGSGRVVGCATFVPDAANPWAEELREGEASIRMMAVAPAGQGRGVGAALLARCVAEAGALGREAVFLHSTPEMVVAHRLYQRAGFARVPERDWRPAPTVPLLAFRLPLPSWRAAAAPAGG